MNTESQLTRLGLFDARVPRYTSYPTAPHFSASVGPGNFTDWVSAIPRGCDVSLYIHVPFCRRLCWFCACRTQGTSTLGPVQSYVEVLKAELAMLSRILPEGVRLGRLHWGGGTPTLLDPALITDLARAIAAVAPLAPGAEFSVEIDPNEIDGPRLDALVAAGMTRASIGVQDFDPLIQKTIGRDQSYEITAAAVEAIRARGIASLNADILYGLPHQTQRRITDSVQKLLSLSPDRVALYGYAHVPWMARRQTMIPSDAMPTPEERLHLFETARRLFAWDGYEEIGIDHFARPGDGLAVAARTGRLRRNFQGYTDDTAPVLIGLGASSISRFPQGYAQNAPATSDYIKAVRGGGFATARGHVFRGDDLMRARLIEAVMSDFAISTAEISETFGVSAPELTALFHDVRARFEGMIEVDAQGLRVPPEARPLTRMIARCFDAYDQTKAQHSAAI
ncbi:oxygen-independent coproporphyrinogen III oxidase [Halodurantibacterium flavum]|uniref:Coproporphyrinogen-III oxidase n=1 Tax=Halodurantibacterium flavum TaxID=1382802 RepID=A0ABW4S7B6_9RHOB